MKLRKKITSTVQVLTHLKEKLQFVQAESHVQKRKLHAVEQEVAQVSTGGAGTPTCTTVLRGTGLNYISVAGHCSGQPISGRPMTQFSLTSYILLQRSSELHSDQ